MKPANSEVVEQKDKATPRPWSVSVEMEGEDDGLTITIPEICRCLHDWEWADQEDWDRDLANAELIVTAVNERASLLAENERLREELRFVAKNYRSWTALDWANWIKGHVSPLLNPPVVDKEK